MVLIGTAIAVVFLGGCLLNKNKESTETKSITNPAITYQDESQNAPISTGKGMPIIWTRFNSNDIDGDNLLSPLETELMDDHDVSSLFEYSVNNGDIDFNSAYVAFTKLSTSKLSRVLKGISDLDISNQYLSRLANEDLERAVEVILNLKEGPYDITILGEGSNAGLSLVNLNSDLRDRIMKEIEKVDPGYHSNILSFDQRVKAWAKKNQEILSTVPSTTKPSPIHNDNREYSLDNPSAIEVFQHEYAITRATDRRPILQSFGAGPCVIVTLYDSVNKIGSIAHVDGTTDIYNSFDQTFAELNLLRRKNNSPIEARIMGGAKGLSEKIVYAIQDRLAEQGVSIVERDFLHYSINGGSASIQLDTKTGKVTNYNETNSTRTDLDEHVRKLTSTGGAITRLTRSPDSVTPFKVS